MLIDEARCASLFVDGYPHAFKVLSASRKLTDVVDDLAGAHEQLGIIENRLAHRNAVLT
jgi:hypothetical protein